MTDNVPEESQPSNHKEEAVLSLKDMLETAYRVKGEKFSNTASFVAMLLKFQTVGQMYCNATENEILAESLGTMHWGILNIYKAVSGLTDAEFQEAYLLGFKMLQKGLQANILDQLDEQKGDTNE